MTPLQRKEAAQYLKAFDFSGLFTDPSIGWDWPDSGKRLKVPSAQGFRELEVIAEKKGVKVLLVPPLANGSIMPSDERKKLEATVTPLAAEHLLIFVDQAKTRQIWLWTSRLPGKPIRRRELNWEKNRSNELLLQKVISIAFTLDEEEALDITGVVHRLHDNLDRDRLTKRFYDDFKKHKDRFQKFISGLSDQGVMAHYTSLMLNRLMFCYFLQQKGFLDDDEHYLKNRFDSVRATLGKDKFHSFYISFLKRLFHDGLDSQARPDELTAIIGKNIPYLNGGIFAEHKIERDNPKIQIPDEAFEKIFAFFDAYDWHLDDRPLANGNEINPEVLGYVFEKYTNQKEMGAYYTKEDITEYISKNTILPFLLQKVAAKLPAEAWDLLNNDPDRYIYEPVRRGAGADEAEWEKSLPENIAIGLESRGVGVSPTSKTKLVGETPTLLKRRKDWNTPTPASHALPTEIWRETIARHQRCHELRKKLRAGEVTDPADLVTLNLDIRQFVQDLIASAPADLALAMWKALRAMSVLDPTCGSGAFLFAALEILEPLYEGLLERLRALLADWQSSGEKHPNWEKEIQAILAAVDRHPNEAYFIHKTIIVHNLYGVDIMEEAVEICKLRLFLKLAAQLEPGQAVEPLPDIDFNVRSGNTLVGYASRNDIRRAFTEAQGGRGGEQMALLGIENSLDDFRRIMEQAEDADRAFRRFQDLQDTIGQSAAGFRTAKEALAGILKSLRSQLDRFLAGQYDQKNLKTDTAFKKWQTSHEPFHWFVEFYGIMDSGGFDVIVGNPPYVEYKEVKSNYTIRGYETDECSNLYAYVAERSSALTNSAAHIGLIIPVASVCTDRYTSLQKHWMKNGNVVASNFNDRPGKLFDDLEHIRLSIILLSKQKGESRKVSTTDYRKWLTETRDLLFPSLSFTDSTALARNGSMPKVGSEMEGRILAKLERNSHSLEHYSSRNGRYQIYYTRKLSWFVQILDFVPKITVDGEAREPSELKSVTLETRRQRDAFLCLLNSSIFYWLLTVWSDCRNLNKREVLGVTLDVEKMTDLCAATLEKLAKELMTSLKANSKALKMSYKKWGEMTIQCIYPKGSKSIIDQIDTILAEHYGFTPEELDFIINYDIKYRMGLGGGSAEEDDEE
ncbi:MAG: Eco57I restriction-modification methylase domain-containing protein [Verrucomicrobia bacterium]|nr:Eco57I restriction-modification methylase domain-containing protein [Verrucomicrobiota bacterium]